MRTMLTVYTVHTVDGVDVWHSAGAIHAERVRGVGRGVVEQSELFGDFAVRFRVRGAHRRRVSEGCRVEERGGWRYNVEATEYDSVLDMLTLVCSRVNE